MRSNHTTFVALIAFSGLAIAQQPSVDVNRYKDSCTGKPDLPTITLNDDSGCINFLQHRTDHVSFTFNDAATTSGCNVLVYSRKKCKGDEAGIPAEVSGKCFRDSKATFSIKSMKLDC